MKLNFKWVEKRGQFTTGENLMLNKILVANYHWNVSRPQGRRTENDWVGNIDLPQITHPVYSDSQDIVKKKIEKIVTAWFTEAICKAEGTK